MPPKTKQPTASTSSDETTSAFPALPTVLSTKPSRPEQTPDRSPVQRPAGITQAQKQALIDNLQLEITERARKLRAQYALQAQGLRARLELRVNRIPMALRKTNMQELVQKHAEQTKPKALPPLPSQTADAETSGVTSPDKARGLKRTSDHVSQSDDKENDKAQQSTSQADLPNPKKRAKTTASAVTAGANARSTRTASRKILQPTVLSPKSHNSRILPHSPLKPQPSPEKPTFTASRPISPTKPAGPQISNLQAAVKAPSRAASRTVKRAPAAAPPSLQQTEDVHRESETSSTSVGTTITTKPGAKKAVPVKKTGGVRGAMAAFGGGRKAAAKKENMPRATAAPATGGRVLRKRG